MGLDSGVRNIIPMLHLTRTWNSVTAVSTMRRGLALAQDYAQRRIAFGAPLAEQPLHADTMAGLRAETEAAFHLTFYLVDLLGRDETGDLAQDEAALLRLLTSIVKLTTGRQAVAAAAEVVEAFGGAGYVEDTGVPLLLRDSQVFPIWEGTTNVLALDVLKAVTADEGGVRLLQEKVAAIARSLAGGDLGQAAQRAEKAVESAVSWLEGNAGDGDVLEAGARRFALTLGRALALALLAEHAAWSLREEGDGRSAVVAKRFSQMGVDLIFTY
jgi:hypothetical protein